MLEFQRIADAIATVAAETGKPPMRLALCQWGRVSRCASVVLVEYLTIRFLSIRINLGCGLGTLVKAGG